MKKELSIVKHRKISALLALTLTLSLALSACGNDKPQPSASAGGEPSTPTSAAPAPAVTDIAIGTAASGGAWYPIGAVMSDIVSTSDLGISATVQTTGGGVENCKLTNNGDCELSITIGYLAYNAQNGIDPYEGAQMDNISCLFGGLSVGVMQVVLPGNSDVHTFADLKGKKVAVGPAGGGAITCLSACLEMEGVAYSEITPTYVSYDEGVTMMTDGHVDAAIVYGGIPTSAVSTLVASQTDFRLLTLTAEEQAALLEEYTYFVPVTVPADMYSLGEDVLTIGTPNVVIVSSDMPEDTVYDLCALFFTDENLEKIQGSQPSAKGLTLEKAATQTSIPLHPGAEKYFREKGLLD